MATNKNNMSNPVFRSRIKKYDMYQNTRGSFARQNMSGVKANNSSFQRVERAKKDTTVKASLVAQQQQTVQTPSIPQVQSKPIVKNQNYPQNTSSQKSHTTHRQKYQNTTQTRHHDKNTSNVALRAVAASQLKENELYPDNDTSLYGTAERKLTLLQKMMYGFASVVLIFSAFVSAQSFMTNIEAQEQISTLGENTTRDEQGVSEGTGNEPSEEPIDESVVRSYVPQNPEDPRFLRIPSLGIFSRIKTLGVTPDGAVDAPRNIYDTGWYNGSARPGSRVGSSLILGHVSGWTGPGVFKKINELPVGGEFEIEKGTGEIIKYSVVRSEKIPLDQVDMSKVLSTEEAGKHDLKLMTCSGSYNSATETFEERFIVYAKQI